MDTTTPFSGRNTTSQRPMGRFALGIAALALMAACSENPFASSSGSTASPTSVELVERDVEAPEIFQTTTAGLWDGRPSLGGVWVAHPSAVDPERVIIRNPANGNFVIGALFRRERDNPGPALQVSSDAASALGMLAGSPQELNVTALRRQEAAEPAATPESAPVADPGDTPAPAAAGEITTATLDAAPAAAPADAPAPTPAEAPAASATAAAPAPAAAATSSTATERPYIQLGIFSVEANAGSLVQSLNADGLPASAVAAQVQGKPFWRVIVGPAATTADRDRYLAQIKTLGFNDAYAVRN